MPSQLSFLKEFDSFQVEPTYLEISYGSETFRFGYAKSKEDRKFSVRSIGQIQIALPDTLLQYQHEDVWNSIFLNFSIQFEDVLKLGQFVEKLARVAGYNQEHVAKYDFLPIISFHSEDDDENDDEFDETNMPQKLSNQSDCVEGCVVPGTNMTSTRPMFSFMEDANQAALVINFTAGYFEVTDGQTGECYRFAHPPAGQRTFQTNPRGYGLILKRQRHLINAVMWQRAVNQNGQLPSHPPSGQRAAAVSFVNMIDVDVFFDLPSGNSNGDLNTGLANNGYIETN